MKPATAPPAAPRPHLAWTIGLVAAAAALVWGLLAWREDAAPRADDPVRAAAAEVLARFSEGLPRPFAPGLVLERVHFEDMNLVMTLRSENLDADTARNDPAMLAAVRAAEAESLRQTCSAPDVVWLLGRGGSVTRRFLDLRGRPFFEIMLTAAACVPGSAPRSDA